MTVANTGERYVCKYPQESSLQCTESAFCTDQVQKFTVWKTACFFLQESADEKLDFILKAFPYSYYARVQFQTTQLNCTV